MLLEKEVKLVFNDACLKAFECLNERLISASIIVSPDWSLSFEVTCYVNGVELEVFLGQWCEKILHSIYYASKELNTH